METVVSSGNSQPKWEQQGHPLQKVNFSKILYFHIASSRLFQPTMSQTLKSKRGEDQERISDIRQSIGQTKDDSEISTYGKVKKTGRNTITSPGSSLTKKKRTATMRSPGLSDTQSMTSSTFRGSKTMGGRKRWGNNSNSSMQKKGYSFGSKTGRDPTGNGGTFRSSLHDEPGPGNYEPPSKIQEGPKYSIYGKPKTKIEPTPGPGMYETVKKEEKGFKIGTRKYEKGYEDAPAPG